QPGDASSPWLPGAERAEDRSNLPLGTRPGRVAPQGWARRGSGDYLLSCSSALCRVLRQKARGYLEFFSKKMKMGRRDSPRTRWRSQESPHLSENRLLPNQTKISLNVPPGTVNVVGRVATRIGLDVEELDDEGRPLHPIGVGLAWFVLIAGKGEVDL